MSVGCSKAAQAPGLNNGSETPVPVLTPWMRRLLLTALLVVSGWVLFSGTARADDGASVPCAAAPVDALPAEVGDLATVPAEVPSPVVCGVIAPEPEAADTPTPEAPAPEAVPEVPPTPVDLPLPVVDVPPVVPDVAPSPVAVPVPPVPDPPVPVDVPVVDVPVPQAPAVVPMAIAPVDKTAVAPAAPTTVAAAVLAPPNAPPAAAVACAPTQAGILAPSASIGTGGGVTYAQPTTARVATSAPAGRNSVPGSPPTPLDLPVPAPGPACPTAGSFTGASGCGTSHNEYPDGDHVVLGSRSATPFAAGPVHAASAGAGAVVGGADDPGTRPG